MSRCLIKSECVCLCADLLCDLSHLNLQVIVLLRQSPVLLKQRLANPRSHLQVSLFLCDGGEKTEMTVIAAITKSTFLFVGVLWGWRFNHCW